MNNLFQKLLEQENNLTKKTNNLLKCLLFKTVVTADKQNYMICKKVLINDRFMING